MDLAQEVEHLKRFGSRRRERFLSPEERQAVLAEIDAGLGVRGWRAGHIEPYSAWAIKLLMLTGQRRDEILTLEWSMVDWQRLPVVGRRSDPRRRASINVQRHKAWIPVTQSGNYRAEACMEPARRDRGWADVFTQPRSASRVRTRNSMHAYRLGLLCRPLAVLLALAGCTTSQQAPRIQRPVIVDGSGIIPINSDLQFCVSTS